MQAKQCVRKFNTAQYDKTSWLTACPFIKKFYCWPCLLFNADVGPFTVYGFGDLNNFHKAIRRHEISANHIVSTVSLVSLLLNTQHKLSVEMHNETVKRNICFKKIN